MGVDRRLYEQVEEMLIAADVGVDGTVKIVDELERRCTAKKIETASRSWTSSPTWSPSCCGRTTPSGSASTSRASRP